MLNNLLLQRRDEIARALRNFHYERTDDNRLFLPRQRLFVGGVMTTTVNGKDAQVDANLIVNEGLDDVLACYLPVASRGTVPTNLYFAPYVNDISPAATLTAANYNSIMDEFTNYTQSTRAAWTGAAVSGQATTNTASPALITAGSGGGTVRGAALVSASAKESTSGKMFCCAAFSIARVLAAGDELRMKYDLNAVDA